MQPALAAGGQRTPSAASAGAVAETMTAHLLTWKRVPRKPGHRGERGQALIEFVFMMPFVLLFMLIIIDFGIGLNHRVVVTGAAREGARYGATGASSDEIKDRTMEHSEGLVPNVNDVEVRFFDTNGDGELLPGDAVAVRVQYSYNLVTELDSVAAALGASIDTSFEMNACTDMRLEQVWSGAVITPGASPCK